MWDPQPGPQTSALLADWVDDLFYGGERGGGKSDFQLGYQEDGALFYGERWRGIMFRKTYPELEELQSRALELFPQEGAIFKVQPSSDYPFSNCWYWPSGASVKMRYMEREQDYARYHGHQYTGISNDEVTEYQTPGGLLKMMSTLRSPHGVPCSMRSTGNPGGPGHVWVKQRYIDGRIPFTPWRDQESGLTRMFIPSKLSDNVRMSDPAQYRRNLLAATAGNEALRKAWLAGDWNIVVGAFFDCWSDRLRLPAGWKPPANWTRFGSFDWGSAKPFSYSLYAIADDDHYLKVGKSEIRIPRGSIVNYAEWYGAKEGQTNTGLKLTAEQVADGILQLERHETKIDYRVADPSIWKEDGGPSVAERMFLHRATWDKTTPKRYLQFRPADNSRVAGWDQLRGRMLGEMLGSDEADMPTFGDPLIFFTENCKAAHKFLPAMQHDLHRVEDIDTDSEDHKADDVRYACMSRPISLVPKPRPAALHPHSVRALFGDAKR